jgi:hypothetical protein
MLGEKECQYCKKSNNLEEIFFFWNLNNLKNKLKEIHEVVNEVLAQLPKHNTWRKRKVIGGTTFSNIFTCYTCGILGHSTTN